MTSLGARRTPSVSELQAALLAARHGAFAAVEAPAPPSIEQPTQPTERVRRAPTSPPAAPPPAAPPASTALLVGAHGGSGARSVAAVLPGAQYAGRDWPDGQHRAVLVCRSTHRGLAATQALAREYRDGLAPTGVRLLGVIVVADCPGRLPAPLRRMSKLMSGAVPILGEVPWIPAWRLGPPQPADELPGWATALRTAIDSAPEMPR